MLLFRLSFIFFLNRPASPDLYTLSLHDALPISFSIVLASHASPRYTASFNSSLNAAVNRGRSEEHTSLQSPYDLVCRLLLEKKKVYRNSARLWNTYTIVVAQRIWSSWTCTTPVT